MDGNMLAQNNGDDYYLEPPRRRSRLDICLNILRAVRSGVKKPTRIMYAANISWTVLKKILKSLVAAGFLSEIESQGRRRTTRHYEITESGLNILIYLDKGNDFLRLMESTYSA